MAVAQRSTPGVLELQGAWWAAQQIDEDGSTYDVLSQSFLGVATGHVHDRDSLLVSLRLLEDLELVQRVGDLISLTDELKEVRTLPRPAFVEAILVLYLTRARPLWLFNAHDDNPDWKLLLPQDAAALLAAVFEHPGRREAFVLNVARKVDADLLAETGSRGEEAVVEALRHNLRNVGRNDLADTVVRMSLVDDTLGYDITSPDTRGRTHLVEAKATKALGSGIDFFLSRNEARVGNAEPMWSIVVAQDQPCDTGSVMVTAGWLAYEDIASLLPQDAATQDGGLRGRWQSVKITVETSRLRPGLPLDRVARGGQ